MFDADGHHQGSTTTILGHLFGRVGKAFHERHDTRRGQGAVLHGAALGTKVRQVVAHTATAFHQLHLLLVGLHNAAVGVGIAVVADNKAIRQRRNLEIVANTCHGTALGYDVTEILQHLKNLLFRHRVAVFAFNAGNLTGDAMVHIVRRQLVDVAVAVLQSIFVGPNVTRQRVAMEIFLGRCLHLLDGIDMVFDFGSFLNYGFSHLPVIRFFAFHHLHLGLSFQGFRCKTDVLSRLQNPIV